MADQLTINIVSEDEIKLLSVAEQGLPGAAATIKSVSAERVDSDQAAEVVNNGTELEADLHFKIPQGVTPNLTIGTVTTGAIGSNAGASITGTPEAPVLNLVLPLASKAALGIDNVTNESKATMFNNPTFTGSVSGVTRNMVGLGNVDNTSDTSKPISAATQTALNLKADLVNGIVPAAQLPSYVDDVLEYDSVTAFPATGESGKIYIAKDTNITYRWGGTVYVVISDTIALGETSSTAYRGDRGKTAYDHSQETAGNPHGVTAAMLGLGSVTNVAQMPLSYLDTDSALTNNSDVKVATQKAVKAYVDTKASAPSSSVDGEIVAFSGATGKIVKNTGFNINILNPQAVDNNSRLIPLDMPNNYLVKDKNGVMDYVYFVPAFCWDPINLWNSTTWFYAFLDPRAPNGISPGFYCASYQSSNVNSIARSLPGKYPWISINYDNAKAACEAKNFTGEKKFHLMTNAERAALALWCQKNAYFPSGNTNYGQDTNNKQVWGKLKVPGVVANHSLEGIWATGSGGRMTSHDGSSAGIFDLKGNCWEWLSGMKMVDGRIFVGTNGAGGAGNNYQEAESAYLDSGCSINTPNAFVNIVLSAGSDPGYLKGLCLLPNGGTGANYDNNYFYVTASGERVPVFGGAWSLGSPAGLFNLGLFNARSDASWGIGFRFSFTDL